MEIEKISIKRRLCKVCGDFANVNNYGAFSCHSCKTFFRRNALHPELLRACRYGHICDMNIITRKACAECRLKKCFFVGMNTKFIRKEDQSSRHYLLLNKFQEVQNSLTISTLDLLENDRSLLTTTQRTLFSNVIHAYDKFSFLPKFQNILMNLSSPSMEYSWNSSIIFKLFDIAHKSTHDFIRSIPDYQVLNMNEQKCLLERNLYVVSVLCIDAGYRDTNYIQDRRYLDSCELIYGREIIEKSLYLIKHLDSDSIFLKFMHLILAFSSNCFLVKTHRNMFDDSFTKGTYHLYGSQNVYVELIWKYMIYRYGFYQTIVRFQEFIKYILDKIKQVSMIYQNHDMHHDFVDLIVEVTKTSVDISQNQLIPLWGKTMLISSE